MPKAVSEEEMRAIQLSILRYFQAFCEKHHLRFYLAFGTMLGAVRHKGYIPWDDDIDLMMPRPDYLRFMELFDQENHETYRFIAIQNNPQYFATFGKIVDTRTVMYQEYGQIEKVEIGVYIDIFPMDGIPDDEKQAVALYSRTNRLARAYKLAIRKFTAPASNPIVGIVKGLISIPYRIIGSSYFINRLEAIGMSHPYDEYNWVGCVTSDNVLSKKMKREHLEPGVLVEFEGDRYPIPAEWDTYLTNMFGDYMQPPPEDERQQHYYTVFWK